MDFVWIEALFESRCSASREKRNEEPREIGEKTPASSIVNTHWHKVVTDWELNQVGTSDSSMKALGRHVRGTCPEMGGSGPCCPKPLGRFVQEELVR